MTTDRSPEVSVVIPAHDAEDQIGACLESVFRNRSVDFEVIVVDDASGDGTADVAAGFPCRLIRSESNLMAANCRNLGARHARGELIVFFDADETMGPDTLRRFRDALRDNPGVDAVVGSLTPTTPAPGFFSRFKNLQHHLTHQRARTKGATLDSGRMAIRGAIFEKIGGFEPAFAGASIEDIALGYRMTRAGHRIRFEPDIQVVHHKRYDLVDLVRSDVLHRAIPWTGLMLRERMFRNDLNTRAENVGSVALAGLGCLAALVALLPTPGRPTAALVAFAAFLTIPLLNLELLVAARRHHGAGFALRAALFLPFMYVYHGVGLMLGVGAWALGGSVAGNRAEPTPSYTLSEPEERVVGADTAADRPAAADGDG